MPSTITRRRYLTSLVAGVVAASAGCIGTEPSSPEATAEDTATDTENPDSSTTDTSDDGTASTGTETAGESLDLREANVTAVTVGCDGRECRFDVTLYHDDDGEDGYANWWQVETRDGERLGRRDLLHAHGTREFTRSATVSIPEEVTEVVVRGHDQTHGYGGQAMLVNVETGETTAVRQGLEPDSFAG